MRQLEQLGIPPEEAEAIKERVWRRIMRNTRHFVMGAVPEEEPLCSHGAGIGYCHERGCPHA